jgi:hypothetical protein
MNYEQFQGENFEKYFDELNKSICKRSGIGFVVLILIICFLLIIGLIYNN